jgi:hypothetical protein
LVREVCSMVPPVRSIVRTALRSSGIRHVALADRVRVVEVVLEQPAPAAADPDHLVPVVG